MERIPTGFDAGLGGGEKDLPTLNEILADLNKAIWEGQLTTEEAEQVLEEYGDGQKEE